mgnify:CR=1 FL=1
MYTEKPFLAKNVDSVHCSKKCSNETYRNKKRAEKIEMKRQVNRNLKFYNLDAIISLGYLTHN